MGLILGAVRDMNDVRSVARAGRETFNHGEMYRALTALNQAAPDTHAKDVAYLGLTAMDAVDEQLQLPPSLAELSRTRAGDAALKTLTMPQNEYVGLKGVSKVGEELTIGSRVCEPNLAGAEMIMNEVVGMSIPGPAGVVLQIALDIGQALREAGTTGTKHAAILYESIYQEDGDRQIGTRVIVGERDYDWLSTAGVYNAAFNYVGKEALVDRPDRMAGLANFMLRVSDENIRRYRQEAPDGYTSAPDSRGIIADKMLDKLESMDLTSEQAGWVKLARVARKHDQDGDAVRMSIDAMSKKRDGDAVGILSTARLMMGLLPDTKKEQFALEAMQLVHQASAIQDEAVASKFSEVMNEIGAQIASGSLTAGAAMDAAIERLTQKTNDPWLEVGSRKPETQGVGERGKVVQFGRTALKVRKTTW